MSETKTSPRHFHGGPGDNCSLCGHNFRYVIHLREGEQENQEALQWVKQQQVEESEGGAQ